MKTRVAPVTHIFFDIGGVLGTDGWDVRERAAAVDRFNLDAEDFERRHRAAAGGLERGRITLHQYLDTAVFHRPRPFTQRVFEAFMRRQSRPYRKTVGVARALAATRRYVLMTINNESAELNLYRLHRFGLQRIFVAFFTSCWVGATKPGRRIYEVALNLAQANPSRSVFIDDRERNLTPARALGMHAIRYTNADQLRTDLRRLGVRV